jgi:hypothetical protein
MSGFLTAFALSFVLAFLFGYLCGSIPFGLILTKLAGTARSALHRLRQYRRDQCAAHRQQGPRRCDPARRHAEGNDCRDRRRTFRRTERRDRRWVGASVGHLFLCG